MTITLTADVEAGTSLLPVSNPTQAAIDDVLKIESELVVVRGKPSATGKLLVGRGFLGSAREPHPFGAALTQFALESDPSDALPTEWTVTTGAGSGSLDIQADGDAHVRLRNSSDHNATVDIGVTDAGGGAVSASINVESQGGGLSQLALFEPGTNGGAFVDSRGLVELFSHPAIKAIAAWDQDGNVLRFALLPTAGHVMIGVTTAPPDGDLSASQVALWLDDTNGAAKLRIKGRSANGTVVVGEVALS